MPAPSAVYSKLAPATVTDRRLLILTITPALATEARC